MSEWQPDEISVFDKLIREWGFLTRHGIGSVDYIRVAKYEYCQDPKDILIKIEDGVLTAEYLIDEAYNIWNKDNRHLLRVSLADPRSLNKLKSLLYDSRFCLKWRDIGRGINVRS